MATKKAIKKTTRKVNKVEDVNMTKSFNKIKDTAVSVNNQLMDTATVVAKDLKVNGEVIGKEAIKTVRKAVNKVTAKVNDVVTVENIKSTVKTTNDYTVKTADELVEVAIKNGEKWQAVTNKAIKGGFKLASKNQDIVFDTLENVKDQLAQSANRFKKLLK